MNKKPRISEFITFYNLLLEGAPDGYAPWLFALEPLSKDPLSTRPWASEKSRLSFDDAIRFLNYGFNIGISAREGDPLVLVDIDDMDVIPENEVKPTLSATTRSRVGSHNYYFSADPKCNVNIPTDYGEIRSRNQYLVCPGSFVTTDVLDVPNGQKESCGFYTICNPIVPTSITFDEFPKIFRDHVDKINSQPAPHPPMLADRKSKSALFDLTLDDVISYPKNKTRFASPFHDTKSGANASSDGTLVQCWRHLVSHNAIQALSVLAGMYTCQEAGVSHANGGSGPSMLDLRDGETLYTIWQYARENGYIPKNDPPPSSALRYFVVEAGICNLDDIKDGWCIPTDIYREAIWLLSTNI